MNTMERQLLSKIFMPPILNRIISLDHITTADIASEMTRIVVSYLEFTETPNSGPQASKDVAADQIRRRLHSSPRHCQSYINLIASAFKPEFVDNLRQSVNTYNLTSGFGGLADSFIQERTVKSWIHVLSREIAFQLFESRLKFTAPPQYDGPPTDFPETSTVSTSSITQVTLAGTTVKEAWFADGRLRSMELSIPASDVWSPRTPGR